MDRDSDFKNRYLSVLKKLISDCEDICIREAGGKLWMELKLNGYYFPLSEVSDGTVHLLVLLLMLNLPEHNGISMLAIDEPEMNLHPALPGRNCLQMRYCAAEALNSVLSVLTRRIFWMNLQMNFFSEMWGYLYLIRIAEFGCVNWTERK